MFCRYINDHAAGITTRGSHNVWGACRMHPAEPHGEVQALMKALVQPANCAKFSSAG